MKIKEIWFDSDYIFGRDEEGKEYKESLLWYPKLQQASDEERNSYTFGMGGIHWRNLDVDISYESFEYEEAEPNPMQRFFLTHKEINVAEFARKLRMNPTLLRNYINGFKKLSKEREKEIVDHIHKLGEEMVALKTSTDKVCKIERVQDDDAIVHLIEKQVCWDKGFSVDSIAFSCDMNFSDKYPDMTMDDWKKIINDYKFLTHQPSSS